MADEQGSALDFQQLVQVAAFQDRFEAEELALALADEDFEVSLVESRPSTMGSLTASDPMSWAIVVVESEAERATALVREWAAGLESSQDAAEQSATAEATPPKPS